MLTLGIDTEFENNLKLTCGKDVAPYTLLDLLDTVNGWLRYQPSGAIQFDDLRALLLFRDDLVDFRYALISNYGGVVCRVKGAVTLEYDPDDNCVVWFDSFSAAEEARKGVECAFATPIIVTLRKWRG